MVEGQPNSEPVDLPSARKVLETVVNFHESNFKSTSDLNKVGEYSIEQIIDALNLVANNIFTDPLEPVIDSPLGITTLKRRSVIKQTPYGDLNLVERQLPFERVHANVPYSQRLKTPNETYLDMYLKGGEWFDVWITIPSPIIFRGSKWYTWFQNPGLSYSIPSKMIIISGDYLGKYFTLESFRHLWGGVRWLATNLLNWDGEFILPEDYGRKLPKDLGKPTSSGTKNSSPAEQIEGLLSSFQARINEHLNPLYQQEASRQRLIKTTEEIIFSTERSIAERQRQEFMERQKAIMESLGKIGVKEKLTHVRDNVWKRGIVEPIEEPFEADGVTTQHKVTVGYRLIYHCPAVAEIEGETNLRETLTYYKSRYGKEYFPISETQVIEIRVVQVSSPNIISVDSFSRLNIPDEFRKLEFDPIMDPEWLDECFVFPYVNGVKLDEVLAPISSRQSFSVPRYENPKITLSKVRGYEDHAKQVALRSDGVEAFDEFLAQDCAKRFQKGKLPQQTKEFWLKYLRASDSYFNQESKEYWLRFIQGPDSHDVFKGK